jgi:hypothetical protein
MCNIVNLAPLKSGQGFTVDIGFPGTGLFGFASSSGGDVFASVSKVGSSSTTLVSGIVPDDAVTGRVFSTVAGGCGQAVIEPTGFLPDSGFVQLSLIAVILLKSATIFVIGKISI